MELKLSELDTMNPYDTFDYEAYEKNGGNYWEKPTNIKETQQKKRRYHLTTYYQI